MFVFRKIFAEGRGGVSHFLAEGRGGLSFLGARTLSGNGAEGAVLRNFGAAGAVLEIFLKIFENFLNKNAIKIFFGIFSKILKIFSNFLKFFKNFQNFSKFFQNFRKIC